jgi:hypothetical protein
MTQLEAAPTLPAWQLDEALPTSNTSDRRRQKIRCCPVPDTPMARGFARGLSGSARLRKSGLRHGSRGREPSRSIGQAMVGFQLPSSFRNNCDHDRRRQKKNG